MTPIAIVVAADNAGAIGRGNTLPWHLPDDLKRFKALTLDKTVLMGRRTAEAIGRPLPGRRNLVLTRSGMAPFATQVAVAGFGEALALSQCEELVVIGGADVYAQALPLADTVHLTRVDTEVDAADAWFADLDPAQWRETWREFHPADARHAHPFHFVDYARIRSG